jgi:hypothetical protein
MIILDINNTINTIITIPIFFRDLLLYNILLYTITTPKISIKFTILVRIKKNTGISIKENEPKKLLIE